MAGWSRAPDPTEVALYNYIDWYTAAHKGKNTVYQPLERPWTKPREQTVVERPAAEREAARKKLAQHLGLK